MQPQPSAPPSPEAPAHVIGHVMQVRVGRARPGTRPGSRTAIDKQPVTGPVAVGPEGLAGDEQGDTRVHGGPDKAVHAYPLAHYPLWQAEHPGIAALQPGGFGENLCVQGPHEHSVCLGDVWQIGSVRLVVSQGRQPCWKLADRFGLPHMPQRVQDSLRTGWYLRVAQPGQLQAGDAIRLLSRPWPDWPLARLLALIRDRDCTPATLRQALALPLPDNWQRLFQRRLDNAPPLVSVAQARTPPIRPTT